MNRRLVLFVLVSLLSTISTAQAQSLNCNDPKNALECTANAANAAYPELTAAALKDTKIVRQFDINSNKARDVNKFIRVQITDKNRVFLTPCHYLPEEEFTSCDKNPKLVPLSYADLHYQQSNQNLGRKLGVALDAIGIYAVLRLPISLVAKLMARLIPELAVSEDVQGIVGFVGLVWQINIWKDAVADPFGACASQNMFSLVTAVIDGINDGKTPKITVKLPAASVCHLSPSIDNLSSQIPELARESTKFYEQIAYDRARASVP